MDSNSNSQAQQQSEGEMKKGVKKTALKKSLSKKDPKKTVTSAASQDGSKKRKAKKVESYSRFIFKVLRTSDSHGTISSNAMSIMNSFTNDMFERIAMEASRLAKVRKSKTLSARDIECATKLLLPGNIARHAVSEGIKAVARYSRSKESKE